MLPNPQDPVTYRLSVWQLMVGQTGTQAMKANQPILTKLVDEPSLAFRPDAVTGPCQSPHLCDFVWNVQALDRMGRPIKGYNDSQQVAAFQYDAQSGAFKVQQPNSPIINNEDAPGLKKQKKSTGQKQYILGVNLSFLMVAPPQGGGNQPGGAQPMATPGPSARGVQLNQDTGVAPSLKQVDQEIGKLKQNPKYILNRGTSQEGGNPPGHEQRRKLLNQQPVGSLSQSVLTAVPRTPGTTGSTPHDKQSYSLKVVEINGDDATAINAAPLPVQPKGITATANSSSAQGTKSAVLPNHAAPSPAQPKPGMIFDRWGNLVVEPGPEQPKMNTGAGSTQTRTKKIPVGGGAPVTLGSGFTGLPPGKQATPQTRVGPCPPHVLCRGEDVQSNAAIQAHPAPIPNPSRAPEARQEFPVGNAPRVEFPVGNAQKDAQPAPQTHTGRPLTGQGGQPADALTVSGTPGGSVNAPLSGTGRQATQTFTVTNSGGTATGPDRAVKPTLNQNGKAVPSGGQTGQTPQQPGTPITAINITLPANPDARKPQTPGGAPANPQPQRIKVVREWSNDTVVAQPAQPGLPATVGGATVSGPPYVSATHGPTANGTASELPATVGGASVHPQPQRIKAVVVGDSTDAVVAQPAQSKAITGPTNNPPGPPTNKYANDFQALKDPIVAVRKGAIGASANGQSANGSRSAVNPNPAAPAPRQNKATQPGQLARTAAPRVASQPQPRRK